jgi:hypothetical protein
VVVQGQGPGPRYGHVMDLVAQRYLVTVSGNDGEGNSLFGSLFLLLFKSIVLCYWKRSMSKSRSKLNFCLADVYHD